ncbi:MAG: cytochrome c, class, partial [Phenylobacterium sp.]|nr:cytochrome c, class [Phenylobacterium sp.]
RAHPQGATLYAGACASCHEPGAPMMQQGRPPLPLGTPLHEADPRDTLQIILQGLDPPLGGAGPYMPAFASSLTDPQVAEIAAYVRARFSDRPAWSNLTAAVAKARSEGAS